MEQSSGGDADAGHVAIGANRLEKMAEPYLAGLDPEHVGMVKTALSQLEMVRREQVILMMPAAWCGRARFFEVDSVSCQRKPAH